MTREPSPLRQEHDMVPATEWRALFHDSPLAIAYVSRDLRLLRVNGPFAVLCKQMAGEMLGRPCYEVFGEAPGEGMGGKRSSPCSFCRATECLATGKVQEFIRPLGSAMLRVVASPLLNDGDGRAAGAVLMISNITAEAEFRERVIETQRLATVGMRTSGVAHELKNPLTCILGFSQLLKRRPDLPDVARQQLERIWGEARRCDHIVGSLLTFTRRRANAKERVDVNRAVAEAIELLRFQIDASGVVVHEAYHPEPLEVLGHICEIQQVTQNIMTNALEAIRDARPAAGSGRPDLAEGCHGGELIVRTRPQGDTVVLEFENDGPRLAEPDKLFQPFYTTKAVGKGTGLGLSVCDAIVRGHGGSIEAANLAHGVTFRVAFPKAHAPTPPPPPSGTLRGTLAETPSVACGPPA